MLRRRGIVGVMWLLLCLPAVADRGLNISGQIRIDGGRHPTRRMEVRLETRGMLVNTTFADTEGAFAFTDLLPNLYHVVVDDPEYQPFRADVGLVGGITQTAIVLVNLVPRSGEGVKQADERDAADNPYLVDANGLRHDYPQEAVKAFKEGTKREHEGKLQQAIARFKKAVEIDPDFYQARNNLGSSYLALGRLEEAEAEFLRVTQAQRADAAAYLNLGNVYLMMNRAEDSYRFLQEGLKRQPDSAKGQFLLGTLYSRVGRFADAEKQLRAALKLDATMSRVHLELVNLYLRQHQPAAARTELELFLSRFPEDPMAPKAREVLARIRTQQ